MWQARVAGLLGASSIGAGAVGAHASSHMSDEYRAIWRTVRGGVQPTRATAATPRRVSRDASTPRVAASNARDRGDAAARLPRYVRRLVWRSPTRAGASPAMRRRLGANTSTPRCDSRCAAPPRIRRASARVAAAARCDLTTRAHRPCNTTSSRRQRCSAPPRSRRRAREALPAPASSRAPARLAARTTSWLTTRTGRMGSSRPTAGPV